VVVAVCPTGTAPKLIVPGETLSGPPDPFTAYPQPVSATTMQQANMVNSSVHKASSLWIGWRLPAQNELNNCVTSVNVRAFQRQIKKKNCK
jgi:hypothetical protein